jgi:hypothetical protein
MREAGAIKWLRTGDPRLEGRRSASVRHKARLVAGEVDDAGGAGSGMGNLQALRRDHWPLIAGRDQFRVLAAR